MANYTVSDYMLRTTRSYVDLLARGKAQNANPAFTDTDLAPQFRQYYESGERIRVVTTYANGETWTRTGTVGVTTGWKPAFLLMSRSSAFGSSDVLGVRDVVVAIKRGARYYAVANR